MGGSVSVFRGSRSAFIYGTADKTSWTCNRSHWSGFDCFHGTEEFLIGDAFEIFCVILIIGLTQDTAFSLICTVIFLRPIVVMLRVGNSAARQSSGYDSLRQTAWMTVFGASLAVFSSTLLYVNVFVFILKSEFGHPMLANPFLNPFAFGMNMDSVCNDVGVLLVSGVLKHAVSLMQSSFISSLAKREDPSWRVVAVIPSGAIDSRAYDPE